MMRQICFASHGGPDVLQLREVPIPEVGPGQILIKLVACGLNYIDTYHRTGLYPVRLPSGLGLEGAGLVEAVGAGVTRFQPGDMAAFCQGPIGAYADYALVPQGAAVKVPAGVDGETAAAILLKGLTAEFLVRRIRTFSAGENILFHAAAGGVGLIACAWFTHLGVRVIGTVGSEEKAQIARQHGCADIIHYRNERVPERVSDLTAGAKCVAVFDSVGADTFMDSLDCAARRGLIVSFGNASGPPPAISPLELSKRGSLMLTRPTLFDYVTCPDELDTAANALFQLVEQGVIKPVIGARFALEDAADAHRALESRATFGSTILIP